MRDDFTLETKIQLAKRVGYLCSFPGCGSLTIGPSKENENATSSTGVDCHISAASAGSGARRYNPAMSGAERKSISNGIWMCQNHGKMIDTDETRFSTELLKQWKGLAEEVTALMVQKGYDYGTAIELLDKKKLFENQVVIQTKGNENRVIGNLIHDSCLPIVWGKDIADVIRDYAIQHFRNAMEHGKATKVEMRIEENKVIISDDGTEFRPQSMADNKSNTGGALAVQTLLNAHADKLVLITNREGEINNSIITLLGKPEDILRITPCSVQLSDYDFHIGNPGISISKECDEFYVVLPPYFALSDVRYMPIKFPQFGTTGENLIFIVQHLSARVISLLQENYPQCKIIHVPEF